MALVGEEGFLAARRDLLEVGAEVGQAASYCASEVGFRVDPVSELAKLAEVLRLRAFLL